MQAAHLRDGAAAEALAARHLERHGFTIIARNVRCRGGEVDLIADDGRFGDAGAGQLVEVGAGGGERRQREVEDELAENAHLDLGEDAIFFQLR